MIVQVMQSRCKGAEVQVLSGCRSGAQEVQTCRCKGAEWVLVSGC